ELQRILDQRRQAGDALPEVPRLAAQVHRRQIVRWAHHSRLPTPSPAASAAASSTPENPTPTPFASTMRQARGAPASTTSSRSNDTAAHGPDPRTHRPRAASSLRHEYIIDTDRPCSCAYAFDV